MEKKGLRFHIIPFFVGLAESEYYEQLYKLIIFFVIQLWLVYLNVYQLLDFIPQIWHGKDNESPALNPK